MLTARSTSACVIALACVFLLTCPSFARANDEDVVVETDGEDAEAGEAKEVHLTQDLLIAYVSMGVMAMVPIYVGAYKSIKSIGPSGQPLDRKEGDDEQENQSMTSEDAKWFPVMASCVLFGLYLAYKFLPKDIVNILLTGYFALLGTIAAAMAFTKPILKSFLPAEWDKNKKHFFFAVPVVGEFTGDIEFDYTTTDLVSFAATLPLLVWYVTTKHWIANNIIGLAFCIEGVEFLPLGTYKTACILLSGLFFYDIFWVFGTDVMVTVAKSFDAPIKLLFPKNISETPLQFSMLGLGDIVIPGVFIALLLRFDLQQFIDKTGKTKNIRSFAAPHFWATYVAYFASLFATVFVMHTFQAAQPALLYIVPGVISVSAGVAMLSGTFGSLLKYTEEGGPIEPMGEGVGKTEGEGEGEGEGEATTTKSD